jgi:hypothetical protein
MSSHGYTQTHDADLTNVISSLKKDKLVNTTVT